ncbi:hypothetical protein, partial [Shewanella sp.]|uniref:hypothetical protein n=1 Tax=Shewanella sp. TaxID=50422 RepID=UPI0025811AF8
VASLKRFPGAIINSAWVNAVSLLDVVPVLSWANVVCDTKLAIMLQLIIILLFICIILFNRVRVNKE